MRNLFDCAWCPGNRMFRKAKQATISQGDKVVLATSGNVTGGGKLANVSIWSPRKNRDQKSYGVLMLGQKTLRWRGLVHASVDIPTADILKIEKEGSLKMGRDVSILKVYVRPDSDALVIMEGTSFCGYGWTKKGRYRAPNLEEGALLSPAVFEFYVKKSEGIEWFTSINEQRPNGDEDLTLLERYQQKGDEPAMSAPVQIHFDNPFLLSSLGAAAHAQQKKGCCKDESCSQ